MGLEVRPLSGPTELIIKSGLIQGIHAGLDTTANNVRRGARVELRLISQTTRSDVRLS